MTQRIILVCYVLLFTLLSACSSDRYRQKHDSTPARLPNQAELKDAIARAEPYSRGGNKNYQVWGKPYQVLTSAQGFEQTGLASWYGKKFHGHLTSNGEIYDMYSMSAAHKNLPLPTYLQVTNTTNNKSVVVRVNDRGPFHQSRIIDLSYSAAYKLDMLKKGTAHVKITAITNFDKKTGKVIMPLKNPLEKSISSVISSTANIDIKKQFTTQTITTMGIATPYIQVFATSKKELAMSTANKLKNEYKHQTSYPENQGLYRIQIGPISDLATLNALLLALKENGYPNAYPRTASQ
ncbi:MAG TPA: septal ring lytic transglycosylase RlpA [Colwellia sp.]|nr:septal ring lytic transglycosylase RlpA [Colwellia sp.]